jgi:hypothetical protein
MPFGLKNEKTKIPNCFILLQIQQWFLIIISSKRQLISAQNYIFNVSRCCNLIDQKTCCSYFIRKDDSKIFGFFSCSLFFSDGQSLVLPFFTLPLSLLLFQTLLKVQCANTCIMLI